MKKLTLLMALLMGLTATHARAGLNIVATTGSMGVLARAVGGKHVSVKVLAPSDRDAHYLQAKPSMMAALRGADLVVANGAELEIGWLPPAIEGANNPNVVPGSPGYFEAAQQVTLIDQEVADRAKGDVHPEGNPHLNLDPVRLGTVALALADAMAKLDGAGAKDYMKNAKAFQKEMTAAVKKWKDKTKKAKGVVFYHKDGNYLAKRLGVPILGYVEPLPGVPPTGRHLSRLVKKLKGKEGVVISAIYHPQRGGDFVATELKWKAHRLPLEPAMNADTGALVKHIGQWVDALAGK